MRYTSHIVVLILLVAITSLSRVEYHEKKTAFFRKSGALEALGFWSAQRSYPNHNIPKTKYYDAYLFSNRILKMAQPKSESLDQWRSIGPHNIGGRTLDVEIHPLNANIIYAGSASGGLWRSHTGGVGVAAWEYVGTGFPVWV